MTELKDRCIRFDWAIKRLLRQKANFGVLEGFLTVFIGEPIKIVEILESEGNQESSDDKFNRVDIKAKNSKGEIIIVEVQNTTELYYLERILYGVAKAITEHMKLGESYKEVKKVYSISILYFDLGKGADYLYIGQNNFTGVHTKDQLMITTKEKGALTKKAPAEIFPEYILIRVNEFNKVAKTPIEEWIDYLKNGIIKEDTTAPGLQEARQKLQYYSMNNADRHAYDEHLNAIMIQNDVLENAQLEGWTKGMAKGIAKGMEQGMAKGMAKGMEQGMAKGMEQGLAKGMEQGADKERRQMVQTMHNNGLTKEQIAQFTNLSVEQVNAFLQA